MYRVAEHTGLSYLSEVTRLLQRARREHRTDGVWEAADRQWWWRTARTTDHQPMPFWYDDKGPVAAAVTIQWPSALWLDIITVPSAKTTLIRDVVERGQALVADHASVEMLVDDHDEVLIGLLGEAGFRRGDGDATAWLSSATPPEINQLPDGYKLHSRATYTKTVHHFVKRSGPDSESRLRQTSLYRDDLDLFVTDDRGDVAAYGLFWNDPVTGVGLVEPMRTEQPHQGRGLARHVLTTGINRLIAAGSERIKVSYETDNPPAVALYMGVGFEPAMTCSIWARQSD